MLVMIGQLTIYGEIAWEKAIQVTYIIKRYNPWKIYKIARNNAYAPGIVQEMAPTLQ